MYKKVKFPYLDLRAGDVVCCDTRSFFSGLTRTFTGGGLRHFFDHNVCTHVGILFDIGGQLLIAEMNGRSNRLEVNSLERYNAWDLRVISIRRPIVRDEVEYGDAVQDDIGELIRRSTEYDYRGLLEFVNNRVVDKKDRMVCSELVYALTREHVASPYPKRYADRVSPQDLATCPHSLDVWHR
jgi:hypothetical protein